MIPAELKLFSFIINLFTLTISLSLFLAVPPNIADLKNLEVLNMFNNQIDELPTQISSLQKLKHLNLGLVWCLISCFLISSQLLSIFPSLFSFCFLFCVCFILFCFVSSCLSSSFFLTYLTFCLYFLDVSCLFIFSSWFSSLLFSLFSLLFSSLLSLLFSSSLLSSLLFSLFSSLLFSFCLFSSCHLVTFLLLVSLCIFSFSFFTPPPFLPLVSSLSLVSTLPVHSLVFMSVRFLSYLSSWLFFSPQFSWCLILSHPFFLVFSLLCFFPIPSCNFSFCLLWFSEPKISWIFSHKTSPNVIACINWSLSPVVASF